MSRAGDSGGAAGAQKLRWFWRDRTVRDLRHQRFHQGETDERAGWTAHNDFATLAVDP